MRKRLVKYSLAAAVLCAGFSAQAAFAAMPGQAPLATGPSDLVTQARYVCWRGPGIPGSGMGPQRHCRWVPDRPRRCYWRRGIPGSGMGPQRVCNW